jgi:hypothetical protein
VAVAYAWADLSRADRRWLDDHLEVLEFVAALARYEHSFRAWVVAIRARPTNAAEEARRADVDEVLRLVSRGVERYRQARPDRFRGKATSASHL